MWLIVEVTSNDVPALLVPESSLKPRYYERRCSGESLEAVEYIISNIGLIVATLV